MLRFGQQLMLLAMACLALQTAHGWFLKLPKLEAKLEAKEDIEEAKLDWFEGKKQKEFLKKLDFLNLFTEKVEAKLEKKEDEWEKFKQWWDEKKEKELAFFEAKKDKELAFFEAKKDKELAFFEGKLSKKTGKKSKSKKTTVKPCYSYQEESPAHYYSGEEVTEADYEQSEEVTEKPRRKNHERKSYERPAYSLPTIYDVRDDSAEGIRYFT
ncbi:uncharacterized protein LOC108045320 [Drosophila rhopaloa]|uniref:Uncharacterized protein LOC108045320 n=1 Tax=Drosophila rhopaloa TaxID=1041015 RepID=A0A6P4ETP7_DRORH|nr:uncharacterized protein LOC108045320 [Drosophila rhopaloa]